MLSIPKVITTRRLGAGIAFAGAIALSVLILAWPSLRYYRQPVLVESALRGNISMIKLLLVLGADVNEFACPTSRCLTPIVAAAEANQVEAVQLLLARGANVNKRLRRGQTALMFASYHGDTEMVRVLLSSGADPNVVCEGESALSWAKQNGHAEIVNLLVAAGATR
jgi:ankyrin repeat protein